MPPSNPQQQTQTTKIEIPPWLEPNLKQIAGDASALYSGGYGPQFFPGQTWMDFNPFQTESHRQIADLATSGNTLTPRALDYTAQMMDRGGISQAAWDAMAPSAAIGAGQIGINTGQGYRDVLGTIEGGNSFFQQRLADQSRRIADQVNAQMLGAGRYGSGAHTGVLADRIGELQTAAMSEQYNRDIANRFAGLQGLSNVEAANIQNMLAAGKTQADLWQEGQRDALKAAFAAPTLAAERFADPMRLAGLGDLYQAKQQEILQEQIARHEFEMSRPWTQLSLFSGALQGQPQKLGETAVTTLPKPSTLQSIMGPAAIGAGIGNMVMPGFGALIGGGLGAGVGGISSLWG
jgi:hypothetical protein